MPRREIGIRTIFNLLGPLTNPLGAEAQLIGVGRIELAELFTQAIIGLGCRHSLVVCSADGMDEISTTGPTQIIEQNEGRIKRYTVTPEEFGLKRVPREKLALPNKEETIAHGRRVLQGQDDNPHQELVLLNAAAAIYLGGLAADLKEGFQKAQQSVASGAAMAVLEKLVAFTKSKKVSS